VSSDRRPRLTFRDHTAAAACRRRRAVPTSKPDLRLFVRRQRGGNKSVRALAAVRGTINAAAQPPSILSRFGRYFIYYIIIRRRRYYYLLAR